MITKMTIITDCVWRATAVESSLSIGIGLPQPPERKNEAAIEQKDIAAD
jgi:hypothetical protein